MTSPAAISPLRTPARRALIVDDDVEDARIVADTLAHEYEPRIMSLEAALRRFYDVNPQILLVERWIRDPDQALRFVRNVRAARSDLGILFTSRRPMTLAERVECWDADADGWIMKPFHPSELAAGVSRLVRRGGNNAGLHPPVDGTHHRHAAAS